ncbi:MAG: signal peptidase II [bacterium]
MDNLKVTHARVFAIFSLILILDQLTKYLIRSFMSLNTSLSIIPGFFNMVYVMNKGGAFGLFSYLNPLLRAAIFIGFSLVAILALLIIYWKSSHTCLIRLGIAFLMGGAIGNLMDRLRWGMVVDFLDFYIGRCHWPAFNVADMAICTGLGLVFLELLVIRDDPSGYETKH